MALRCNVCKQRLQEMLRIQEADALGQTQELHLRKFSCDRLVPETCFDIYRPRIEQTPERIPTNVTAVPFGFPVTPENQERALLSPDVEAAQAIIGKHVLPEWHAPEQAPQRL